MNRGREVPVILTESKTPIGGKAPRGGAAQEMINEVNPRLRIYILPNRAQLCARADRPSPHRR